MTQHYFRYIFALLLFGTNGIVASHIRLSSYEIVFWRTLIGSGLLICLFFLTRQKPTFQKHRRDLIFIVLSGISMGASWIFLYEAYARIGVSLASLAYYCGPVIVMILSPVIFKEKLTAEKVIGFLLVLGGIFLVNGRSSHMDISRWGLLCGLLSAVMYALMVMLNKQTRQVKGLENASIQLLASFFTVAVFTVLKTGGSLSIPSGDMPWIVVLGLLNTGAGCYLYFSSIGSLPVQTVAILGYLEPLSAVLLAVLLLNEVMLPLQMLGAILIIGGAVFGERARLKPKAG